MINQNAQAFELPKTYGETLYQLLKDGIITGEFKSGQRMQERFIAERFQVSITPVREALRRLSAEEFVTIDARKEVMVAEISNTRTRELYEILTHLDFLAIEKAITFITTEDIAKIRQDTARLQQHYQEKDILSYLRHDMQLHMSIWKHCKNDTLLSLLKNLNEKYAFVCNNIIAKSANPISYLLIQDHLDLITELEAKNLPAIKQLIASHWGKGVLFE